MLKAILIPILIIASFLGLIFGAYLPYMKANAYINSMAGMSSVSSVQGLEADFTPALQMYSPIGQRETVKFTLNTFGSIATEKGMSEQVVRALIDYIEPYINQKTDYIFPLISMGGLYFTLYANYSHAEPDYQKALAYFKDAYGLGPKLPPVLYSLFQLYTASGDLKDAVDVARQINTYWPSDQQIAGFLKQYTSSTATSTAR
ncbi:tetratricopeptide repeat protein [Patescibacteria group bacterium]|nr:tetratricopeptide repeat protein [Patescibacteria group bacterium]